MSTIRTCPQGHLLGDADLVCPKCGTLTNLDYVPLPATLPVMAVPGYDIVGELGRGGMGLVYRAVQVNLKRPVALKVILTRGLASAQERVRFRIEAEAIARLQHPNIVQIYDFDEHQGQPYFSLELMEGGTLAQRLRDRPLPPRDAADLIETLARAVHFAHGKGIVHRDLKPGNILLAADGTPKIADFGLAKTLDGPAGASASTGICGTAMYMAPEQAGGKGHTIGPAADVYALGVILYECLTGRPPFLGETLDVLQQHKERDPLPPARLQPKVPRDLETICLQCLRKEPAERYGSAAQLAADLRCFLDGEPLPWGRPIPLWQRAVKWAKRRPAVALLLGVSVLAVLTTGGLVGEALSKAEVEQQALLLQQEVQRSHRLQEEAEHLRYLANMRAAHRAEEVLFSRTQLEPYLSWVNDPGGRLGFEWYYLWRRQHAALRTLPGHAAGTRAVAFHRDGRWLATGGADGTVRVWDAHDGRQLWAATPVAGTIEDVAFSPDGALLAAAGGGAVRLWHARSGAEVRSADGPGRGAFCVAFSPDGRQLAAGGEGSIRVWDVKRGDRVADLRGHAGAVRGLAFCNHPALPRLVSGGVDRTIRFWDLTTGTEDVARRWHHAAGVWGLACSADGTQLAWVDNGSGTAMLLWQPLEPTRRSSKLRGHAGPVYGVAFTPNGWLVTGGEDKTVRLWDAAAARQRWAFDAYTAPVWRVAFSPNPAEPVLASAGADGRVKLWHYAAGEASDGSVIAAGAAVAALTFDAGGRLLIVADPRGPMDREVDGLTLVPLAASALGLLVPDAAPAPMRTAASLAGTWGPGVRVRDLATGAERIVLHTLPGARPTALAWRTGGQGLLAGYADGTVKTWQPPGPGQAIALLGKKQAVRAIAQSRDGRFIARFDDLGLTIWDEQRQQSHTLPGHGDSAVAALAFRSDGKQLASAGADDMQVRVWTVPAGAQAMLKLLHTAPVTAVAFSPDGARLASGGEDGSVHLWDTRTGQEILVLHGHFNRVPALAFSADGKRLASGDADGTVKVWDARLADTNLPTGAAQLK